MDCPDCKIPLRPTDCHGVRVDECPKCLGDWFDRDELRRAKDSTDEDLRWLDFDPFEGVPGHTPVTGRERICPRCGVPMGPVAYGDSGVVIDKCAQCHGIWLDHDEFAKIVAYLERTVDSETVTELGRDAGRALGQVFVGPEGPVAEMRDLLTILRLLRKRLGAVHTGLSGIIDQLYSVNPFK